MTYLPHVDGLRAVAIASVVVFHAFPTALPGGYLGVDVFFVISGFLITRLIAGEITDARFSFAQFLARRMRRLLPAQVVLFVGVFWLAWHLLWPEPFEEFANSLVAAAFGFANIYFSRRTGYFDAPLEHQPLLHFWSLGVEDQFYLVWPLLLLALLPRCWRSRAILVVALLAFVSLVAAELLIARRQGFVFFNLPTRAFELLIGAALALAAAERHPALTRPRAEGLAWGGIVVIVASFVLLSPSSRVPGFAVLPACLGTAAVIAAAGQPGVSLGRLLTFRPVVFLGLVSYSLYLWHWPLMVFARLHLERDPTPIEMAAVIAVSFIAAVLSWRFVERPFRNPDRHAAWPARRTLSLGVAVMSVAALAGVGVRFANGVPARYPPTVATLFAQKSEGNPLRPRCDGHDLAFVNDATCNFGRSRAPGESYDLVVVGDSNADHFVPLVAEHAERAGLAGRQVTQSICAPLLGLDRPREAGARNCDDLQRAILKFVADNPGLKLVVMGGNWRTYGLRLRATGILDEVAPRERAAAFRARGADLAEALDLATSYFTGRGIAVHIFGQIPATASLPLKCAVDERSAGRDATRCGIPRAEAERRFLASDAAIRDIVRRNPRVRMTLPSEILCNDKQCATTLDGVFLYRDAGHLNAAGSRALLPYVDFPKLR